MKLRPIRRRALPFLAVLSLVVFAVIVSRAAVRDHAVRRVLFIGNSYTSAIRPMMLQAIRESGVKGVHVEFVAPGGATLAAHLSNAGRVSRVRKGNWDAVVLQDQSQTPALPGRYGRSFHDSVDAWSTVIREAGAQPFLFETWARRDGDPLNPELFPDFETMQVALSTAYRSAAERNRIRILPVGEVWTELRGAHPDLGRTLYAADGSHPAEAGSYLAASVILDFAFNGDIPPPPCPDTIAESDCQSIRDALARVRNLHDIRPPR